MTGAGGGWTSGREIHAWTLSVSKTSNHLLRLAYKAVTGRNCHGSQRLTSRFAYALGFCIPQSRSDYEGYVCRWWIQVRNMRLFRMTKLKIKLVVFPMAGNHTMTNKFGLIITCFWNRLGIHAIYSWQEWDFLTSFEMKIFEWIIVAIYRVFGNMQRSRRTKLVERQTAVSVPLISRLFLNRSTEQDLDVACFFLLILLVFAAYFF